MNRSGEGDGMKSWGGEGMGWEFGRFRFTGRVFGVLVCWVCGVIMS